MRTEKLDLLFEAYRNAPRRFHATSYWQSYEGRIRETIQELDFEQIRSGRFPILATFGFGDVVHYYPPDGPRLRTLAYRFIQEQLLGDRSLLPYGRSLRDLRELAYHHCELAGENAGALPISAIEADTVGSPADLFTIHGRRYTMQLLGYYLRYCFAYKHVRFAGNETVVELGPGAGTQIEVLKKLYPELTVLCFDMPAQIFLCEEYLTRILGERVVGVEETLGWKDLSAVRPGHVHFLGNWQMPLLGESRHDIFWNAASFGEMEPGTVEEYLSYVLGRAEWIYLLQARTGKERTGITHVEQPIAFEDYCRMLRGYRLVEEHDAWTPLGKLKASGGYFEAAWHMDSPET